MNIEDLLKERGLSKSAFADLVGVKKQNINNLLKNPTLETLGKFAEALNIEMYELFKSKEEIVENVKKELENSIPCPYCGKPIDISLLKKGE